MRKVKREIREASFRLTASFEGGITAVAGNFDGQILSYGPLQWNIGQGTLLPVLRLIPTDLLLFHLGPEWVGAMKDNNTLRTFVLKEVLDPQGRVKPEWAQKLRRLASTPEAFKAFLGGAEPYFRRAEALLTQTGWETERGYALAFDTAVQNGAPRKDHLAEYSRRLSSLKQSYEWARLKVWAQTVADLANPRWRGDVLSRKMTIALGQGVVHGKHYILEEWGISYFRKWFVE